VVDKRLVCAAAVATTAYSDAWEGLGEFAFIEVQHADVQARGRVQRGEHLSAGHDRRATGTGRPFGTRLYCQEGRR